MEEKVLSITELLRLFDEKRDVYQGFCETITNLLKRLLEANDVTVHSIVSRCKSRMSFEGKVAKKLKYKALSEITDLAGVRIITHYSDDVDVVSKIIEEEFEVDQRNSIDKKQSLDPDRFGYLSRHYVVSLLDARAQLSEYAAHKGLKVEIQVRSVLQHAWAEIEHDIGYKIKVEVPDPIKRRFSRLAGLLELADQEFISIRKDNSEYIKSIQLSRGDGYLGIGLDVVSLSDFIKNDPLYRRAFSKLLDSMGDYEGPEVELGSVLESMLGLGLRNISELYDLLQLHEDDLIKMYKDINTDPLLLGGPVQEGPEATPSTTPLYMLEHVMAAKKGEDGIDEYLAKNNWTKTEGDKAFKKYLLGFFTHTNRRNP